MTTSEFIIWLKGYLEGKQGDPTVNCDLIKIQSKLDTVKEDSENLSYSPSSRSLFSYTNSTVALNSHPKVLLTEQDEKII